MTKQLFIAQSACESLYTAGKDDLYPKTVFKKRVSKYGHTLLLQYWWKARNAPGKKYEFQICHGVKKQTKPFGTELNSLWVRQFIIL